MEVGEDEHVIAIELDQQWDDDEMVPPSDNEIDDDEIVPPSDNEIESPPPIPNPSGSDDASDPELLEEEEEEVMDAPAQHPPHPMTLCGGCESLMRIT